MKNIGSSHNRWKLGSVLFVAVLAAQVLLFLPRANAVSLNQTMVRLNRLAKSTATTGTVCAEPSNAGDAEASVVLTFPAGFTVGASWTTDTTTTTGWPSGATAWTTIQATGTGSGQTATFTSGNLASSTQLYCFNWTNTSALTTPSTTGSYAITVTTKDSVPSTLESSTATTDIVDTNCGTNTTTPCDQINVSASVNQSFTFSLDANDAPIGALTTGGVASSALHATVSTNAQAGWQMWAADPGTPVGLHSTVSGHTISYYPAVNAAAALVTGGSTTEGYNLGVGTPSGTTCSGASADSKFSNGGNNASKIGGGLDGTLRTLATSTGVADACSVPLVANAAVSNTTPAATDYAGKITIVAAGLF